MVIIDFNFKKYEPQEYVYSLLKNLIIEQKQKHYTTQY